MSRTALPLAAVIYTPADHIDTFMAEVAHTFITRGVRLGGIIQHNTDITGHNACGMTLEDLSTHTRFPLSQNLGSGAVTCSLDPAALAQASTAVHHAINQQADLIMINKFSTQETLGNGLRDEMSAVVLAGIPLLTAVGTRFLPQWQTFTGENSTLLPVSLSAILEWWQHHSRPFTTATA